MPRAWQVYTVAAAIGLGVFVLVFGPGHLVGTSAYWQLPLPDERASMMGYRYFLAEPWHWPVFDSHTIDTTRTSHLAFWDCIPVWAVVNKAIATIVPPWRAASAQAYLGLWHGLAYVLQACFGVAILRALGHRGWHGAIVGALGFVAVPTWIFRYPHPALSAHWIELWAIYLYLRPKRGAQLGQLAVAALVHPYHAVMSLGVLVASLVRSRDVRTIATWLPLGVACVAAALWLAGYFTPEVRAPQWGFDKESANALGWLVPVRSGILGDARWIANVMATDWQYEGYAYLGLGVLALVVLVARPADVRGVIARHRWLFAVTAVFAVFALSNHVYVGSYELASYPIPRLLRWIPQQFRSPGRFVWVPTYVLLAFVLHRALARYRTGRRFAIVAVAVMVQLVDARGDWSMQRAWTREPWRPVLPLAGWQQLVDAHAAVAVYPAYNCIVERTDTDLGETISTEVTWLASRRALPLNGSYSARPNHTCDADGAAWPTLDLARGTLYVLLPQAAAIADRFQAAGAACAVFDGGRACSTEASAIADAIRAGVVRPPAPAIALRYGEPLDLATTPGLDATWSQPDAGGRWTESAVASLLIRLDGPPPPGVALKLDARARLCGARTSEDVDVLVDATPIGTLHFDAAAPVTHTIAIADPALLTRGAIAVQLRPHDTRPAAKLGCATADPRPLGVWVSRIWLE